MTTRPPSRLCMLRQLPAGAKPTLLFMPSSAWTYQTRQATEQKVPETDIC